MPAKPVPRLARELITEAMFLRPRDPDDHRQFEEVLPQMTPLFIYADEHDRDWVRWSLPRQVAERYGWDGCRCATPGCNKAHPAPGQHSFAVDTAWDEVDWFFDA
jgi:hypothetical protein